MGELRLNRAPTAANAPLFAADVIEAAAQISGAQLDYSVESLQAVDDLFEAMRRDGMTTATMGETVFLFGCYIGEVCVRATGARWVESARTEMRDITPFPIVLDLGSGKVLDPISQAFNRLDNGIEDHLPKFFHAIQAGLRDAPSLHTARERILPRLVPPAFVEGRGAGLVRRPVNGIGLHTVYCIDEEEAVRFIPEGMLVPSGMDVESLHALALSNLAARTQDALRPLVRGALDENQVGVLKTFDTYDAARLLLVPAQLREGESVIAHVPDRDTLSLMPVVAEEKRDRFVEMVRQTACDPQHALLDLPVVVRASGFELMRQRSE